MAYSQNSNFSPMEKLAQSLIKDLDSTKGLNEKDAIEHKIENFSKLHDIFLGLNTYANHNDRSYSTNLNVLMDKLSSFHNVEYIQEIMFRLIAHTRDCRKEGMGRGSRAPTNMMFVKMYSMFPTMRESLKKFLNPLVSHYGSLGDLNRLADYVKKSYLPISEKEEIVGWIVELWVSFINQAKEEFELGKNQSTLAAKYAPRENKQFDWLAKLIAANLFTTNDKASRMKLYRKLINPINKKLTTTEILMCDQKFSDIEYGKIPGRCLVKNRLAWKNLNKNDSIRSTDPDRIKASENYKNWLSSLSSKTSKGAKGNSMFITELSKHILATKSQEDLALFEAQWEDQVKNLKEAAKENGLDLEEFFGNFVMLLDFSGSMIGEPLNLALAMGAFIGPLIKGPFKNKFLSFQSKPRIIDMSSESTIAGKLSICANSPWGGYTDFEAAHKEILRVIKEQFSQNGSKEEILEMIPKFFFVISDMQFDKTSGFYDKPYDTVHQSLVRLWEKTGMELFGEPLKMPTMIYWNARGNNDGIPVTSSTKNAIMISGFSTSILKTFLINGVDELLKFTPWENLKTTLMNKWYDKAVE